MMDKTEHPADEAVIEPTPDPRIALLEARVKDAAYAMGVARYYFMVTRLAVERLKTKPKEVVTGATAIAGMMVDLESWALRKELALLSPIQPEVETTVH